MILKYIKRIAKRILEKDQPTYITSVSISQHLSGERLKGRKVIVSGGASGIGLAIAKRMVEEGARVVITGRDERKLEEAESMLGSEIKGIVWDLCDVSTVDAKLKECLAFLNGELHVLVNNAGISGRHTIEEVTEEIFDRIMDCNLKGHYFVTKAAIPFLQKTINSKIINISSVAAKMGGISPYGLSKAALNSFTQGLAKHLVGRGIIVNGIAPGKVSTPLIANYNCDNLYDTFSQTKRQAAAEEIAELAIFLASDAANNIVGQIIYTDGGATLR